MWPNETEVVTDLLDVVEFSVEQPLCRAVLADVPAAYVWTYRGDRRGQQSRLLDLYYRHLTLTGWPMYVGSAKNMRARRGRHDRNLVEIRDLAADEIDIIAVTLPSFAAAKYAEELLIDAYQPVLNVVLPGVGSSWAQGRNRVSQRPSKFSLLHGRRGIRDDHPARLIEELTDQAEDHLRRTAAGVRLIRRRQQRDD